MTSSAIRSRCARFLSFSLVLSIMFLILSAMVVNEDDDDVNDEELTPAAMRRQIEKTIRLEDTMSTRPFRYYRKVYRQLRRELKGVRDDDVRTTWNVRATRVGKCFNDTLIFSHWRRSNKNSGPDKMTRVELLLPIRPPRSSLDQDVTAVVKGEEISRVWGTVEVPNLLVFNLTEAFQDDEDYNQFNPSAQIEVKFDHCHTGVHRRHAFMVVYSNIPNTVLETFRERALAKRKPKGEVAEDKTSRRRSSSRGKRSLKVNGTKPWIHLQACHVKKLMVDLRKLNPDIVFPYILDIGRCQGSCAHATNFDTLSKHVTGHAILLHQYNRVYGKHKPHASCVPHAMKGELLMVRMETHFETIFFRNAIVGSCRCA